MRHLIHEHTTIVRGPEAIGYATRIVGADRPDGTWIGWIEFHPQEPATPDTRVLSTERETTQPNEKALLYWATGLEPVYIEGAFERAARATAR